MAIALNESDLSFIRKNIENSDALLQSDDPNDLIEALHDYTVDILIDGDVNDSVRTAEKIIDKLLND